MEVLIKSSLIDLEARQGDRAQAAISVQRERLSEGTAFRRCDSLISAYRKKSGERGPKSLRRRSYGRSAKVTAMFTDKGLHKGQIFTWNVYNDVATQGTTLTETSTLPDTNFTIAQGTGTVTELGQAVPYTGLLDNLSKHPVQEIINKVLKNDAKKALDGQAWFQFNQTLLRVVASSGTDTTAVTLTTNGTATTTNTVNLHKNHIKSIVDTMKERNIPPYLGDEYFSIAWPTTYRPVKNDLESVYQYRDEGFQMIYNGEIGKFEGVRFIEQTNVPHGIYNSGNYVTSSSFTKWSQSDSDWAFFFGKTLPHASATVH